MQAHNELPNLQWFRPSPADWEDFKETIGHLYITKKLSLAKVMFIMRDQHRFGATKKMYVQHLHEWGFRKYQSLQKKEALCNRILNDHNNGRDLPYVTPKQVKKLLRHVRETQTWLETDLPNILRSLEDSFSLSGPSAALQPRQASLQDTALELHSNFHLGGQGLGNMMVAQARSSYFNARGGSNDESVSGPSSPGSSLSPSDPDSSSDQFISTLGEEPSLSFEQGLVAPVDEQIPRPRLTIGGPHAELEGLLFLTRNYYTTRLEEYQLSKWADDISPTGTERIGREVSENTELAILRAGAFWTNVKSAIYYLKKGEENLAWPLLHETSNQVPQLSQDQPFTLLRDLFATLSMGNTSVCPAVRIGLLKTFAEHTGRPSGVKDPLSTICTHLQEDWICDEALIVTLSLISRCAEQMLPASHAERFELRRTLVRMLRRQKDFANAESIARRTVIDIENQLGRNHVKTRLARTELVYILNDKGQLDRALEIAEDIVSHAKQDEGVNFPTKRCVYAMEDVAEIYQWLGKKDAAAAWLRRALKGALKIWGETNGAIHIKNKLEALHAGDEE